MAGRNRPTFLKRQKEQARNARAAEKREARQRKRRERALGLDDADPAAGPMVGADDMNGLEDEGASEPDGGPARPGD